MRDVDGLNAGYAQLLLDEYLENPESVPDEWRDLFESSANEVLATQPGLARLLEVLTGNGHVDDGSVPAATAVAPVAPPPPAVEPAPAPAPAAAPPAPVVDAELLGGIAAAMALVKAH